MTYFYTHVIHEAEKSGETQMMMKSGLRKSVRVTERLKVRRKMDEG